MAWHLSRNMRILGVLARNRVPVSPSYLLRCMASGGHGDHGHGAYGDHGHGGGVGGDGLPIKVDIGKREVVGFGMTGEECYIDNVHYPFPAIRFKEDNAEITMLREKEKGDWKKLTLPEKKTLYRAAFCQTFSEIEAPTGDWKMIVGLVLVCASLGMWGFMWCKVFVYGPLPDTITDETKMKAQIDRMIVMRVNPIEGFTSNYDYDKGEWKK